MMESDKELQNLLRAWEAPAHSASLEARVLNQAKEPGAAVKNWWRFLLTGSIRVPVPVALGLAAVLSFGAWRAAHTETVAHCLSEVIAPPWQAQLAKSVNNVSAACPVTERC